MYPLRADALGGQPERRGAARYLGLGEQAVADGGSGHRAPGEDVADGEGPHVDAEDPEAVRRVGREDGVGELGVGGQGGDLQQCAQDQPEEVEVTELMEFLPRAGQLR